MINRRLKYFLIATCFMGSAFSQSLSQAQRWFNAGEFERAKPVFRKLAKRSPSNATYNYWYGACCYETGELMESLPYLEKGADRKVINAYLYLSKAYYDLYRFDDAIDNIKQHIYWLEKKRRDKDEAEALLDKYRVGARMIRGVENVTVIDSIVVDKDNFLDSYVLSKESGEINLSNESNCTSYTNQMRDKRLMAQLDENGESQLYSSAKLGDKWTDSTPVKDLNETADELNFPFVDSDGITIYYSAKGTESMGGYDIFITRYNTDDNTYLKPDNIGMPFNSPYNDYMYAIDDYSNLGWFASDRYQPEGKVCIYVFIPNESKELHDYDTTRPDLLTKYARLTDIKLTWNNKKRLNDAVQRLAKLVSGQDNSKKETKLKIVINDSIIYHALNEFRSKEAAMNYQDLRRKQQDLSNMQTQLRQLRNKYHNADHQQRENLQPGIIDKEKRINELYKEIKETEKQVRNLENKAIAPK